MFLVDNKCFIYFPKCAGTSIHDDLLRQRKYDIRSMRFHASAKTVPAHFDFEKLALVRNPMTWYNSYLTYERECINRRSYIFFPMNFIMFKDFSRSKVLCSPEESMERALNYKEFTLANPRHTEAFRDRLLNFHSPQLLHNVYYDLNEINPNNFGDTLFQEMFRIYGMKDIKLYKMEEDIPEVYDILGIKEGKHSNVATRKLYSGFENEIYDKDKNLMKELGYE